MKHVLAANPALAQPPLSRSFSMTKSLVVGLFGLAVLLAVPPFLKSYGLYLLSYWLVYVIATMGLNLTVGYAGQ